MSEKEEEVREFLRSKSPSEILRITASYTASRLRLTPAEAREALLRAAERGSVEVNFAVQCPENNGARIERYSDPNEVPGRIDCHLCPEQPPHRVTPRDVIVEFVRHPLETDESQRAEPPDGRRESETGTMRCESCGVETREELE